MIKFSSFSTGYEKPFPQSFNHQQKNEYEKAQNKVITSVVEK